MAHQDNSPPPHWAEELIIVVGLVLMFVVIGMLVWMAFALLATAEPEGNNNATRQACLDMFFGDNSETGYVEALAAKCWKLLQ